MLSIFLSIFIYSTYDAFYIRIIFFPKFRYDDEDDEWDAPLPELIPGGGIPVRAIYDYTKLEDDELSFKTGDILIKLTEEDQQGWCRGSFNGREGLYPANYVGAI